MKISIITATYNSGKTVEDTIKSVLGQTFGDWEHVIVDGGSTDNTAAIVHRYEPEYAGRLNFISEPDHGIYDAMNKGIERATGDVVGILNSDDFYTRPTVLERVAQAYDENGDELEAVFGDIMYVDEEDTSRVMRYYSSEGFRRWKMLLGYMPAHPSFYCRRYLYERHGGFDLDFRVASDFENLLRVIYKGHPRMRYLPMNFVTMRMGGASTSGFQSHRKIFADHIHAYRKNKVYFGVILDPFRYPLKIMEVASFRLHAKRLEE